MPVLAAALAAVAIAVPASASTTAVSEPTVTATEPTPTETTPAYVPNTPLTNVYILCDGNQPEGTVNAAVDGHYSSWDENKPTGSITAGEGCGQADEGAFGGIRPETPFEFSAKGFYTGNLDTLTFHMYNIPVGEGRRSGVSNLDVRVMVDGTSLFGLAETENAAGDISTEPAERRISIKPIATGDTGAVQLFEVTVNGINLMTPADNIEHEVVLNVTTTERMNLWAWGNTEAPSGITFNNTEPAAKVTTAVPLDKRG